MVADIMTKPVGALKFARFARSCMWYVSSLLITILILLRHELPLQPLQIICNHAMLKMLKLFEMMYAWCGRASTLVSRGCPMTRTTMMECCASKSGIASASACCYFEIANVIKPIV